MINQANSKQKAVFSAAAQHKSQTLKHLRWFVFNPALLFALCLPSVCPLQLPNPFRRSSCAHSSAAAVCGDWARRLWDVEKFNPHAVRNEVLLLSLLLLQLWSSPNVIRQWPWHDWPGNLKKELRGGGGWWSILIWPVNPEKKGIMLKVSFLCCSSALWVIKISCIRFSLANIAIYNDLTFLF